MMGRLTRNPDIYFSSDGSPIARYTLAVDRDYPDKLNGISTDFFKCEAYGRPAEFAKNHLKKGVKIIIWGTLRNESFIGREGTKVKYSKILVKEQEFAEPKKEEAQDNVGLSISERSFDALPVDKHGFVKLPENFNEGIPF